MSFDILIVDDSAVTRALIKRTIKLTELPIGALHEADNGQSGLELLATRSEPPLEDTTVFEPVTPATPPTNERTPPDTLTLPPFPARKRVPLVRSTSPPSN